MTYEEWARTLPAAITGDALWKMQVYRIALFATDLGWSDVTALAKDRRTVAPSDQLYRALGSISANIVEGYSRGSGKDRARFLEYALGSARESRDWYYKARFVLGEEIAFSRLDIITRIIKLLLATIPSERRSTLREELVPYSTTDD